MSQTDEVRLSLVEQSVEDIKESLRDIRVEHKGILKVMTDLRLDMKSMTVKVTLGMFFLTTLVQGAIAWLTRK